MPSQFTNVWSKTITLVPATQEPGDFSVDFPLDVNYLGALAQAIDQETGSGTTTYNLSIEAKVHTTARAPFGPIDETFTQTMNGTLSASALMWDKELQKKDPHTVKGTRTVIDPNVDKYRTWSVVLLVLILLGGSFVVWNIIRARPVISRAGKEALRAKKKYKNAIMDVGDLPGPRPDEVVIPVPSLDELVKAADNLFKPVLHKTLQNAEAEQHAYCVIDGLTRYEYTSELEVPASWDEFRDRVKREVEEETKRDKEE